MTNAKKSSFYPINSLEDKSNFKRFHRIERDGSVIERVFLDVPDPSERELLICIHYLRHIGRHFFDEELGVNIIARDCPWDFSLEFSTGETANVEITSIADMNKHFIINKSEERFLKGKSEKMIPLHELEKLNRLFPSPEVDKQIKQFKESCVSKNQLVENPLHGAGTQVFVSNMPEVDTSLDVLLRDAIAKKVTKNHSQKEKTVLIIDNRTSMFEISDYRVAAEKLADYCDLLPFPEVWFYTGYCSDNDGNNAEFSFDPLKATEPQLRALDKMAASSPIDDNGRLVW